jgi:hypothetical protein
MAAFESEAVQVLFPSDAEVGGSAIAFSIFAARLIMGDQTLPRFISIATIFAPEKSCGTRLTLLPKADNSTWAANRHDPALSPFQLMRNYAACFR